jgi:hypothetical protein
MRVSPRSVAPRGYTLCGSGLAAVAAEVAGVHAVVHPRVDLGEERHREDDGEADDDESDDGDGGEHGVS